MMQYTVVFPSGWRCRSRKGGDIVTWVKHLLVVVAIAAGFYVTYTLLCRMEDVKKSETPSEPTSIEPLTEAMVGVPPALMVEHALFGEEWHGFVLFRVDGKMAFVKSFLDPIEHTFVLSEHETEVKGKFDSRSYTFPVPKEYSSVVYEVLVDKDGVRGVARKGTCRFTVEAQMVMLKREEQAYVNGTVYRLDVGLNEEELVRAHCYPGYLRDPTEGIVLDASIKVQK